MKILLLVFSLALLTGCQGTPDDTALGSVAGHQRLLAVQEPEPATGDSNVGNDASEAAALLPPAITSDFGSQQEFLNYIHEQIQDLEATLVMLDANLNQILSEEDGRELNLAIRQTLLTQSRAEGAAIGNMTPYNEAVRDLIHYLSEAFRYNLDVKEAEYGIYSEPVAAERLRLMNAIVDTENRASHYLGQAWQELNALSETEFPRK